MRSTIGLVTVSLLFSLLTSYVVYYGFTTNYSGWVFSKQTFEAQFHNGIYKYRVLSESLILKVDEFLDQHTDQKPTDGRLLMLDRYATNNFYLSYFAVNTYFLLLTCMVLLLLLEKSSGLKIDGGEKPLLLFFLILLINFTQFVVCPYDVSSYFLQLLTTYVYLRSNNKNYWPNLIFTCLLLGVSTLNRESSAVTVACLLCLAYLNYGSTKRFYATAAFFALSFITVYVLLRIMISNPGITFYEGVRLGENFSELSNYYGMMFWVTFFGLSYILANSSSNRAMIIVFHLLCLPYILTCFYTGILFEMRLYMPIFLGSIILAKVRCLQAPSLEGRK